MDIVLDLDNLSEADFTRTLGAMLAHFDRELAAEVEGIAEIWAERREDFDAGNDHGMQMGRDRSAADFRALAAAIREHRQHLAGRE